MMVTAKTGFAKLSSSYVFFWQAAPDLFSFLCENKAIWQSKSEKRLSAKTEGYFFKSGRDEWREFDTMEKLDGKACVFLDEVPNFYRLLATLAQWPECDIIEETIELQLQKFLDSPLLAASSKEERLILQALVQQG